MKTLNITVTDEEYDEMVVKKEHFNLNWHDYIVEAYLGAH